MNTPDDTPQLNPCGCCQTELQEPDIQIRPGAPTKAIVPQGTKVQSLPGPGQLPQTFETSVEIFARPEWNAVRPRMSHPQMLAIVKNSPTNLLYLLGIDPPFVDTTPSVVKL